MIREEVLAKSLKQLPPEMQALELLTGMFNQAGKCLHHQSALTVFNQLFRPRLPANLQAKRTGLGIPCLQLSTVLAYGHVWGAVKSG